ncbi:MAG: pyridoxamine 5'-phosphate oxidase [Chitinophagaceae bacterium]|nr:pyridoxamine 5'-phosphate oxidase [Chitinophagaceae bacterium]
MLKTADIRTDYKMQTLLEADVHADPFKQFAKWWDDALKSKIDEVNAMTLATADKHAMPSARIVLLKEFSDKGFVFFTNYQSHKGKELEENPHACLVFFWKELERQVRISGNVDKISAVESDEYFLSRPEGSRIGAWASPQSNIIAAREIIDENIEKYQQQFRDGNVPRPPDWGGYIVIPTVIEFWQGRPSRLHDRIQYTLAGDGAWKIERLAP